MDNTLDLFLSLLFYVIAEVILIVAMAEFVANKHLFFAIITVFGIHYCVSKVSEFYDRLTQDGDNNE